MPTLSIGNQLNHCSRLFYRPILPLSVSTEPFITSARQEMQNERFITLPR